MSGKRKCGENVPENVQEQEIKKQKTTRRPDILITVDVLEMFDRSTSKSWAWKFGEVKTWKSLKDDSPVYSVNYSNSAPKICEMLKTMVSVDTTKFDEVMATMKWEKNRWKITKCDWPHECQRLLMEGFDEEFSNSPGRNCLYALLKSLVEESPVLNIYNVGGDSTKNKKLRKLAIQYNFYSPDSSSWTESSSPEKSSPEKSSSSSDCSTTSTDNFDHSHTPVMDCMVWGPETYLVAEVKTGLLRPEDREQLRHELLSQLSLGSPHCRLVGVLICYLEAQLFIGAKDPNQINIIEVSSYKFSEGNHKEKFSNFLKDMVKLLKACQTRQKFPC